MSYQPQSIATSHFSLPQELSAATERLVENANDLWIADRMVRCWMHGLQRADANKFHPCLVPYDQLPESEKRFDRRAATGTLKAILKLGYRIPLAEPDPRL